MSNLENKANSVGNFLVRAFHYLALFAIGSAIVWSAFFAFLEMAQKNAASIEDILLLFIYLELGAVVGIYFKTNHMPVRFLIYVAITALTRMLLEYLNNWHWNDGYFCCHIVKRKHSNFYSTYPNVFKD